MMVTLNRDAQGHLDRYLRQVKAALRGHPSVDVGEVERDILGHIDAELAGQPEPIAAGSLTEVLNRLGRPDHWVPSDEMPAWRQTLNRLRSGPEDWRLAYLTLALFILAPTMFMSGPYLWPLELLLMVASVLTARASLAVLAEHDEPVGARRWLIYPPLVIWYAALAAALFAWPLPPAILGVTDTPVIHDTLHRVIPGPVWIVEASAVVLVVGLWWTILGPLLGRFRSAVHGAFSPFADWFDRRHAKRITLAGLLLTAVSGITLIALRAWGFTP